MNRRGLLKSLGALPLLSFAPTFTTTTKKSKRVLRIAHLTDVHLDDVNGAPERFAGVLEAVQNMKDSPDIIFNGGDTIMDALGRDKQTTEKQWNLWDSVIKQHCSLDIVHCIGNHDVWAGGSKQDPLYGKKYAVEKMTLNKPYYSFDQAGWHFIVLDSTHPVGEGWYTGKLDEAQMQWLADDLANTPSDTPVFVMSHIPILTATAFYPECLKKGNWEVPGSWMHTDFNEIKDIFEKYPNVKLCVSGHMHLLDRVDYNGVTYMCNGAVSGNWWGNVRYKDTEAGYAIIDLYDDGSFSREYITYSW